MKKKHVIVIVLFLLMFLGGIGGNVYSAIKPDAKTTWTNVTPANRLEPGQSKKNIGYVAGERPGFKTWNWLIYDLGLWADYYEPVTDLLNVSTHTTGGYIGQRGAVIVGTATAPGSAKLIIYGTMTATRVEGSSFGEISNSSNVVLNADSNGDSTGEIQFKINGSTVAYIDNNGKATFKNEVNVSSNIAITGNSTVTGASQAESYAGWGIMPIGSVTGWHKDFANTPALPSGWLEMNGQTVSDSDSPYNGQAIPDWNGAGRFLRGSDTSGTEQSDTYESHAHESGTLKFAVSTVGPGTVITNAHAANQTGAFTGLLTGSVAASGSSETRPDNVSVVWIMRVK